MREFRNKKKAAFSATRRYRGEVQMQEGEGRSFINIGSSQALRSATTSRLAPVTLTANASHARSRLSVQGPAATAGDQNRNSTTSINGASNGAGSFHVPASVHQAPQTFSRPHDGKPMPPPPSISAG